MSDWVSTTLDELVEVRVSSVDKKSVEGEIAVRLCNYMDVYSSDYLEETSSYMRATASREEVKRFRLLAGDVLITKDSESPDDIAVPAFVSSAGNDLVCGYHLAILRPKNSVDGRFLSHLLQLESVNRHFAKAATGSTRYGLSIGSIKNAPVSIPASKDTQRRISELLVALDEQAAASLEAARKIKLIRAGVVSEKFLSATTGVQTVPLGALCDLVTSGSRGWASYYSDRGSIFLRIGNLTREHPNLRFDDVVRVDVPEGGEGARTKLKEGDLLISITADLGIVGSVPAGLGEAYVNQHIALARISSPEVDPRWVAHALASPYGSGQIARLNDGGAKAGLNLPTIRNLKVPVPPLAQQRKIVALLDSLDTELAEEESLLAKLRLQRQGVLCQLLSPPLESISA